MLPVRGATGLQPPVAGYRQISIHAPRTGSDRSAPPPPCKPPDFNPRSPHGERQRPQPALIVGFPISIHAPRTGSGLSPIGGTPERTISIHAPRAGTISIHAPRAGSDIGGDEGCPGRKAISIHAPRTENVRISIHAPRTGSDWRSMFPYSGTTDFNPRSPHGERPS